MARDKNGKYYAPGKVAKGIHRKVAKPKIIVIQKPKQLLYWAYGSNLCPISMARRCPDAKRVGPLVIENGALIFRSVADVTTRLGSRVPGGLWRISKQDEQALDKYEGVSTGLYLKRYLTLAVDGGEPEDCLFYQMKTHHGIMPPSEMYLRTIAEGYEYFGLDLDYLNQAVAESWNDKAPTQWLRDRHVRKGKPKLAHSVCSLPPLVGEDEYHQPLRAKGK